MKRLTLIRHAKSSHGSPWLRDFERPLDQRGRRDAELIGRHLATAFDFRPDRVVCSPAVRTVETARTLFAAAGRPDEPLIMEDRIYEAPLESLLTVLREQPDEAAHVCLVGHNPGSEELLQWLCPACQEPVVTGAVFMLALPPIPWAALAPASARLLDHFTPADIGGGKQA